MTHRTSHGTDEGRGGGAEGGHSFLIASAARGDWVRLRTLIALRWLAVLGQAATVLFAHIALDMRLPVGPAFAVIAASACLNIIAQAVHPQNKRLTQRDTTLFLLFDLVQIGALLFLTGGLTNPFSVLAIGPVIISATALTLRPTLLLGGFAVIEFSTLAVFYVPLVFADGQPLVQPTLIIAGHWSALLIALAFLAGYARRVTAENLAMSLALSATQEALSREQRLTAIGGLAAAAAHELGTPLATIKLVSGELARDLDDRPELREDVELIRRQAERCRDILRELSRGGKDDSHVKTAPITSLIEEAAEPHRDRGRALVVRLRGLPAELADAAAQPVVLRRPEVVHGLRNLVQNAVDFAASTVWVDVDWSDEVLRIAVGDDGPGYAAHVLGRLGDPYIRRRSRKAAPAAGGETGGGEKTKGEGGGRAGYEGMGLGLFIAKTLLERTGARIEFSNGPDAEARARSGMPREFARPPGAIVSAVWPRSAMDPPEGLRRGRLDANREFTLSNI